jgi:hypothetical protein
MFLNADFFMNVEDHCILYMWYAGVYMNFFLFLNEKYNKTPTYNTSRS